MLRLYGRGKGYHHLLSTRPRIMAKSRRWADTKVLVKSNRRPCGVQRFTPAKRTILQVTIQEAVEADKDLQHAHGRRSRTPQALYLEPRKKREPGRVGGRISHSVNGTVVKVTWTVSPSDTELQTIRNGLSV